MHPYRPHGQWHPGETAMHRLLEVPPQDNPTIPGLPGAYALWMAHSPLLALGTVDRDDRIWTTVLGGRPGVIRPVAEGVMGLSSPAHLQPGGTGGAAAGWTGFDPVLEALLSDTPEDDAAHDGRGKMFAALALNLKERTRVKLAGRMVRAAVLPDAAKAPATDPENQTRVDVQLALAVDETLGNCPKYLNSKAVWPHEASPRLVSDSLPLTDEAVELIGRSDIFFLSSRHGSESMDTNNRGGAPGFVRVFSNSADEGVSLVYPEYSGNRLFQTLGNLTSDPAVGITFPDFETGDVLYLSGRADILVGAAAAAVLPHSRVAVKITVEAARLVGDGLPFRGRPLAPSPYNPPVHRLAKETRGTGGLADALADADGRPAGIATATLVRSSRITPTVSRHTFRLSPDGLSPEAKDRFSRLAPWQPGQHVTLDFSAHLDRGWSHMRDHDPTSLNDDYIRSFTISSAPARPSAPDDGDRPDSLDGVELDITVRRHGPVTHLLTQWVPGSELSVPVLELAGEDGLRAPGEDVVVVAGGIGITPLMAHVGAQTDRDQRLSVLWSLAAEDLPLAVDLLERAGETPLDLTLFVTGVADTSTRSELQTLARLGVGIHTRRIGRDDVLGAGAEGHRRFHVCAGPGLRRSLLGWLDGENVSVVDFDY